MPAERGRLIFFFCVTVTLALATVGDGVVLQPYRTQYYQEATALQLITVARPDVHPLATSKYYLPIGLRLPPQAWLDAPVFHVVAAIAGHALVLMAMLLFLLESGVNRLAALAAAIAVLYIGPKLSPPVPQPNPFTVSGFYDFRSFICGALLLGCWLWLKGRPLIAGVCLGIVAWLHVKFGVRVLLLLTVCLPLWHVLMRRLAGSPPLRARSLLALALPAAAGLIAALIPIARSLRYFAHQQAAHPAALLSPLAWLAKNEPDDWLALALPDSQALLLAVMCLAAALVWEILRRRARSDSERRVAAAALTAIAGCAAFWSAGLIVETLLLARLPPQLGHSVVLLKLWDVLWIIVALFWSAVTVLALRLWRGWGRGEGAGLAITMAALLAITFARAHRHGGIASAGTLARDGIIYQASYTEICAPRAAQAYARARERAYEALRAGSLTESDLGQLEQIYRSVTHEDGKSWRNPEVENLLGLRLLREGRISTALRHLERAGESGRAVVWSCERRGDRQIELRLPLSDYAAACRWISENLPTRAAVVQPPYLPAFNMLSSRLGFWDGKVDQHTMYLIPGYYTAGLERLQWVAGPDAVIRNPGISYGDVGPEGRQYFLTRDRRYWHDLRQRYPSYEFVLTEAGHCARGATLFENRHFSVCSLTDRS